MRKTIRFQVALAAVILLAGAVSFAQSGEATYKAKCQSCHGSAGVPNPGIAKAMGVKPATDPSVKSKTEAQMIAVTTNGDGQDACVQGQAHRRGDQGIGGLLPHVCEVRAGRRNSGTKAGCAGSGKMILVAV